MSEYFLNENYAHSIRQEITLTAKAMLANEMSFLIGARILSSLKHSVQAEGDDSDFMIFVGIDSATDHLPLGEVRQYWDVQVLERLHPEIERAEAWARQIGEATCQSLIKRFGD